MAIENKETKVVQEAETLATQLIPALTTLPQEFIKAEKNLETLGFFTPSTRKTREPKTKVVNFTKIVNGKRITASAFGHSANEVVFSISLETLPHF